MEHLGKRGLHTDALKQKYGSIRAVVLRHDSKGGESIRESKLVDEKGIMRTYALALIDYDKRNDEVVKIDNEIRQGGLIGQTFQKYSYATKRNIIDTFPVHISSWMQKEFGVDAKKAKARLVEFYVRKDDAEPMNYATMLEILSPDFEDLDTIEKSDVNPPVFALQKIGMFVDEIWNSLGTAIKNNRQGDLKDKYEKAITLGRPLLKSFYDKMANYIKQNLSSS